MAFECAECGYGSMKWLGRCPSCSQWDTFVEDSGPDCIPDPESDLVNSGAEELSRVTPGQLERVKTGFPGMDRLLGGGAVGGEIVLLGGPPGIGKSTLFLQMAGLMSSKGKRVLYVSGEENPSQIRIHADRIKVSGENITVFSSGNIKDIRQISGDIRPDVIFVDSIQAVADTDGGGAPGTVKQVKKSGQAMTALAKNSGSVVFLSGQITKQGDIAGPKLLEHMVDAVIYMEPREGDERVLTAAKNRFGPCGEFLVLAMGESGLADSGGHLFPEDLRNTPAAGRAYCCIRAGRSLTSAEIQTLATPSYFEYPVRRTSGFSRERLMMLSAIVVKHLGVKLANTDIYLNVSGPARAGERSSDLAAVASLYSGCRELPIPGDTVFAGEVGLGGEMRPLRDAGERRSFAEINGFRKILLPAGSPGAGEKEGVECIYLENIKQLDAVLHGNMRSVKRLSKGKEQE